MEHLEVKMFFAHSILFYEVKWSFTKALQLQGLVTHLSEGHFYTASYDL